MPAPRPHLLRRAAQADAALDRCRLCALRCGVSRRAGPAGACRADAVARVFHEGIERAGEASLVPTYVVSLSGCNWRCAFCLTGGPSQDASQGTPVDDAYLDAFARRVEAATVTRSGIEGIRSVTILGGEPAIHLAGALRLASRVPRGVALVWKTNATASWEGRRLLAGVPDVVLADLKFGSDACARRLAGVSRPWEAVTANLRWAARRSRLIVRHLLMPGHLDCCLRPAVRWLRRELKDAPLSLMTGYLPAHRARSLPEMGRTNRAAEVDRAWEIVRESGLTLEPWRVAAGETGPVSLEGGAPEQPRRARGADEVWIDRTGRILVDGASGALLEALRGLEGEMRLDAAGEAGRGQG